MRKILQISLLLAGGLSVGGAAAVITGHAMSGAPLLARSEAPVLVSTGALDAPLVDEDGRLLGYIRFEAQLRVAARDGDRMRADLPLLLDAINRRSFKTPIAGRPDGMLPRLAPLRKVVTDAAGEAFAGIRVQQVMLTKVVQS